MKTIVSLLMLSFFFLNVKAQDAYHTNLQNMLQTEYSLPAGDWVFYNTETANINADSHYGSISVSTQDASGQDFSKKVHIVVNSPGNDPWNSAYSINNVQSINNGNACLFVVWLRSVNGNGKVSLYVQDASNYDKEAFSTFDLDETWRRYMIPFEAGKTYASGGLSAGLHLAFQAQTIEIGGFTMLKYASGTSVDDLPSQINNDQYGGWEADAPWRAQAADRIDQLRKANLKIRVEDNDGNPVPDVDVEVEMLQHEFAFGTAVVSSRFANNHNHSDIYESKLLDLDGQGHGFNWVVFENSLKWKAWEGNWPASKQEKIKATQWLLDHGIKVRGHTLLWPGWDRMPADIKNNQYDHNYIKNRINEHLETIVSYPGIAGNIEEWDVLNEITTNRDIENAFKGKPGYPTGREIYPEVFEKLAELDPNVKTYINDYMTISQNRTEGGNYDVLKQFIQEIIDAGIQLDGIGFQSHIGGFPNSIYDVYNTLEDFYTTFGKTAKITEYDIDDLVSDELAATYLRDFLTITFSHRSVDGFLMWGFWDGAHWYDNAPLFYQDWTLKPSGQTFIDMVFGEWWTDESGQTNAEGEFATRGFKGQYELTITNGDEVFKDTIQLKNDMTILKKGNEVMTGMGSIEKSSIKLFPNPASDFLNIEREDANEVSVKIFDIAGKKAFEDTFSGIKISFPLDFEAGMYEVVIGGEVRKLIVER